ncbi:MAG: 4Fe-4S dicluster domain-containing protein [Candidatus Azobacteroides sp.]|nr:4Fe-4S dicluster domain-containing protein [Candidatus Azobacteroides sp.]
MNTQIKILKSANYIKLLQKLFDHKKNIYGPVRQGKRIGYQKINSANELATDFIIPDMSAKSFVFPCIEKLFSFTKDKENVEIQNLNLDNIPEKIIVGIRPCDALGMKSLKAIFGRDPADSIFQTRLERTTFIGYACNQADDYCFCTSINGGPGNTEGSDILLTKTDSGDYIAEIITPKGESIVASAPELFEDGSGLDKQKYLADVPKRFDDSNLENKMKAAFDTNVFDEYAIRCIGCAACAYVCPTCACFDIQDRTKGSKGERIRTWDSCGLKLFTLHTSGHNPRETQGVRWRQRLMHKFSYMPERLEVRGCVGCGRCSRRCPVDMNIAESINIITDENII